MEGFLVLFVLAVALLPAVAFVHARVPSPGLSFAAALLGQGAGTVLLFLGLFVAAWDGYRDTGTEPAQTLDEAFPTMGVGVALSAWVWLRLFERRSAAALAAGVAAGAAAAALGAWSL